jgi:uncharacterized protein YecT (DUF1311 family)
MRPRIRRLGAHAAALAAFAAAADAIAGQATGASPPPPSVPDPCPGIAEGYELCASDLLGGGNCAQFVEAAGALAQLYQIQVADTPERSVILRSTNWWGCGSADLSEMKALLARVDTPPARALLQGEPFASVALPAPPPAPPAPAVVPDCEDLPAPADQDACAASELSAARSAYAGALAACQSAVAPALRDPLAESEQAWQTALPAECDAAALDYDEPRLQAFSRSLCLARATRERTRAMLAAHPECAGGD